MSHFNKSSQSIWYYQYHIIWTTKYRYRILHGKIGHEVETSIRAFSEQLGCEIVELNVQIDHVHLLVLIPPKVSVSSYAGTIKGRSEIRILNRYNQLRHRPYWGNHLLARATV